MPLFKSVMRALGTMAIQEGKTLAGIILAPKVGTFFRSKFPVAKTSTGLLTESLLLERTKDGAIVSGIVPPNAYAKFAIPKGLPTEGKKSLAILNPSHTLDSFDGVIPSGYGKGIKSLLYNEKAIIKYKGNSFVGKIEYHIHNADRAGLHYDLCIEGLTSKMAEEDFEIHIPNGDQRGRYAFVHTPKGVVITPMKDRTVIYPKPQYNLKNEDFLSVIEQNPERYVVTQKLDGGLVNVRIENGMAHMRSHRETAQTYTSKMPQLEYLWNKSSYFIWKRIAPNVGMNGTEFQAELIHPQGVSRVAGICNSLAPMARATQEKHGPVKAYIWDVKRYNGKDVSNKPYSYRFNLAKEIASELRMFSKAWDVVPEKPDNMSATEFYQHVISQPLPYGEGIVVRDLQNDTVFLKLKDHDFTDVTVIGYQEGKGRLIGSIGAIIVQDPITGNITEVGTGLSDFEREYINARRTELLGAVAKIKVMETTNRSMRAPVWVGWHPDPRFGGSGSEVGLRMYADGLAGSDMIEGERIKYALISKAGWKNNVQKSRHIRS